MRLWIYVFVYLCVDEFMYLWKNTNVDLWLCGFM